jgi:agmatinase
MDASRQVDLYDMHVQRPYAAGLAMLEESAQIRDWNREAKALAQRIIADEVDDVGERKRILDRVNSLGARVNEWVKSETATWLEEGKIVGVVGGDHSTPLGAFQAAAHAHGTFGVLHFDAHSDTREAYEGFTFSHASIMRNALDRIPEIEKIVQVGIRDVCEDEIEYVRSLGARAKMFSDRDLADARLRGVPFAATCERIVAELPERVWVSFDIDGLDPRLCPHTGTPVPGGLDFAEAVFLLAAVVRAKKTLIGFDLTEVAPNLAAPDDEWDANVGARLLYKLSALTLASQGRASLSGGT